MCVCVHMRVCWKGCASLCLTVTLHPQQTPMTTQRVSVTLIVLTPVLFVCLVPDPAITTGEGYRREAGAMSTYAQLFTAFPEMAIFWLAALAVAPIGP